MEEIPKTDKLFLVLHRAEWSIDDTAFVGKEGISRLVSGTRGDHSIRAEGKGQVEAWQQACRQAEELNLVHPA